MRKKRVFKRKVIVSETRSDVMVESGIMRSAASLAAFFAACFFITGTNASPTDQVPPSPTHQKLQNDTSAKIQNDTSAKVFLYDYVYARIAVNDIVLIYSIFFLHFYILFFISLFFMITGHSKTRPYTRLLLSRTVGQGQ